MYPELVYFDGAHFAHIAARDEHFRIERIRATSQLAWKRGGSCSLQSVPNARPAGRASRLVRHLYLVP
jgi:hypothetical protein